MARYLRTALAVTGIGLAPWALWYFYPHILFKYIATISEGLAGVKAWCTPPLLFLFMNSVVLALAFTSGFLKQSPFRRLDGDEFDDLGKTHRQESAEDCANEEEEGEQDEEEAEDYLYPEVFRSFFGEGGMVTRRKPLVKRTVSTERKGRSFFPSLSHKFNPGPSLVSNASPGVPGHAHGAPKTATFDLKKPVPAVAAAQASISNGGDRDVDERADAFIGNYYKKMKLRQVDPYTERLERSYGR